MSTRSERDRQKAIQDKHQMILAQLLKDEDNKYCVDCDAKGPRWASWNLGIFLCIRCAGIHRNLGVHISKVKSVNLDTWTPEQISMMQEMGNSRARAVYEANIPDNYRRPQTDSALEAFIRSKYETKKYIAHEWVPPKPKVQPIFEEMPKKEKKKTRPKIDSSLKLSAPPGSTNSSTVTKTNNTDSQTKKPTQPIPAENKQPVNTARTIDLLGLDDPPPAADPNDLFGEFMSTPIPTSNIITNTLNTSPQQNNPNLSSPMGEPHVNGEINNHVIPTNNTTSSATAESNDLTLMGDTSSGASDQKKSKESILALYGSSNNSMPQQQMYQVPGGMYMGNTTSQMGGQMGGGMVAPQTQQMYSGTAHMPQQQQQINGSLMGIQPGIMQQQQNNMMQAGAAGMGGMNPAMMNNMGMMGGGQPMYNTQNMYNMQNQQLTQQLQNQMSAMSLGGGQAMGSYQQPGAVAAGGAAGSMAGGWGMPQTGNTLSNNLWQ